MMNKNINRVKRGPFMDIKDEFYDKQLHEMNGVYNDALALQTAANEFAGNLGGFPEVEAALYDIIDAVPRYQLVYDEYSLVNPDNAEKLGDAIRVLKYGIIALIGNAFRGDTDCIEDCVIHDFNVDNVKGLLTRSIKNYIGSPAYAAGKANDTRVLLNSPINSDNGYVMLAKDIRDKEYNASYYYMQFQIWVLGANDFGVGLMNATRELARDKKYRQIAAKHGFHSRKIRKTIGELQAEKMRKLEGDMYDTK